MKYETTVIDNKILGFFGDYRWLSNFHICKVFVKGKEFPSTEHAYMYAKLEDDADPDEKLYQEIIKMLPKDVKKWGQEVKLREGWDSMKVGVMYQALCSKFSENPDLIQKLKDTNDMYLEETNDWNDVFYGVCDGVGRNELGKLLMKIRNQLKWV